MRCRAASATGGGGGRWPGRPGGSRGCVGPCGGEDGEQVVVLLGEAIGSVQGRTGRTTLPVGEEGVLPAAHGREALGEADDHHGVEVDAAQRTERRHQHPVAERPEPEAGTSRSRSTARRKVARSTAVPSSSRPARPASVSCTRSAAASSGSGQPARAASGPMSVRSRREAQSTWSAQVVRSVAVSSSARPTTNSRRRATDARRRDGAPRPSSSAGSASSRLGLAPARLLGGQARRPLLDATDDAGPA